MVRGRVEGVARGPDSEPQLHASEVRPPTTLPPIAIDITPRIFSVRGQKVILSSHLAELYGVPPRALVQTVRRNLDRFPIDFLFPLPRRSSTVWSHKL
jgi:hypothetical protein